MDSEYIEPRRKIGKFCTCGFLWHDGDCDKIYTRYHFMVGTAFIVIEGYGVNVTISGYEGEIKASHSYLKDVDPPKMEVMKSIPFTNK